AEVKTENSMSRMQEKLAISTYLQNPGHKSFVIRIRDTDDMSTKVQKVSKFLHLHYIFNGPFAKISKASVNMLKIAQPYIAWGYLNLKSISVHSLGQYGIICSENLTHEIYTVVKCFKEANNFL
ncbi:60S ribosomal protein L7, partial [Galemys pyrenaicus]